MELVNKLADLMNKEEEARSLLIRSKRDLEILMMDNVVQLLDAGLVSLTLNRSRVRMYNLPIPILKRKIGHEIIG